MARSAPGRAFALVEAAFIIVVIVSLLVLVLVLGSGVRRQGRLGEDIAKLRQIGAWTASYGADNADQFWAFSWKKGQSLSRYPDLNNAPTDLQAGANQAVDILRRVAGREDILPILSWIPHISYSHLVLNDYAGSAMPDLGFVSAGDANRIKWARDPFGFDQGVYQPAPPPGNSAKRWPYGSSFQLPTSFYDLSDAPNRIYQGGTHSTYITPGGVMLGARLVSDVAFPSAKVHLHDQSAWHFGPQVSYFALAGMRQPLLVCDGSVQVRAAGDANPGWHPDQPTSSQPLLYSYQPSAWEPPASGGFGVSVLNGGIYRWTRGYVAGRDFGAPPVCTGQPGCP